MITNKIKKIIVLLSIILININCKKNNDVEDKKLVNSKEIEAENKNDTQIDKKNKFSFVISCGGGCAMVYTENKRISKNSIIEIEFKIETYINEVISETFEGIYLFDCKNNNINRLFEGNLELIENDGSKFSEELEKIKENLCSSLSKNIEKPKYIDFNHFVTSLNKVNLPFSTKDLTDKNNVGSNFFFFEKENNYFTLENLVSYGYFEIKNKIFIIFGFNLLGEGEGFATDMIILSEFEKTGIHKQDIILKGNYGGEGGANIYEVSKINDSEIEIIYKEEYYDSDTGLSSPIIIYKKKLYSWNYDTFNMKSDTYRCENVDNLEKYLSFFKKSSSVNNVYGYSYQLENYLECKPIDLKTVNIYNEIASYLIKSKNHEKSIFLLKKIIEAIPSNADSNLNIADAYWGNNQFSDAKKHYKKYLELMKSQNKDLNKVPKRVYERIK